VFSNEFLGGLVFVIALVILAHLFGVADISRAFLLIADSVESAQYIGIGG
jgi:hypothetical protein